MVSVFLLSQFSPDVIENYVHHHGFDAKYFLQT